MFKKTADWVTRGTPYSGTNKLVYMTHLFWNIKLKLTFTAETKLLFSINVVVLENWALKKNKLEAQINSRNKATCFDKCCCCFGELGFGEHNWVRSKLVACPVWREHGLW